MKITRWEPWNAEMAWEYTDEHGKRVGAPTKALSAALDQAVARGITWRSALFQACELVTTEFPNQHLRIDDGEVVISSRESLEARNSHGHYDTGFASFTDLEPESGHLIPSGTATAFLHKEAIY